MAQSTTQATGTDSSALHICVFERGGRLFGLPVSSVAQICFLPEITFVPAAPEFVCGVMNLRGSIVPVITIDDCLGTEGERPRTKNPTIVLSGSYGLVAVIVDRVLTVSHLSSIVSRGDIDGEDEAKFLAAVCEYDSDIVALLDHTRMLDELQSRIRSNLA